MLPHSEYEWLQHNAQTEGDRAILLIGAARRMAWQYSAVLPLRCLLSPDTRVLGSRCAATIGRGGDNRQENLSTSGRCSEGVGARGQHPPATTAGSKKNRRNIGVKQSSGPAHQNKQNLIDAPEGLYDIIRRVVWITE